LRTKGHETFVRPLTPCRRELHIRKGCAKLFVFLMACQGCGCISQTRLCCPTCIEYGRTTFFCGQECFTKNWKTHSALHDLLKKNRALADLEANGATATNGTTGMMQEGNSSSSGSTAQRSSPSSAPLGAVQRGEAHTRRGLAPLPGGTPLVSSLGGSQKAAASAAAAKKDGNKNGPSGPQIVQSVMGTALSLFRAVGSAASSCDASSVGLRQTQAASKNAAARGASSPAHGSARAPASAALPRPRSFAIRTAMWAIAAVSLTASGVYYHEFQAYSFKQMDQLPQMPPLPTVGGAAQEAPSADTAPAGVITSNNDAIDTLRSDVSSLRQLVDRHEKMLRYIMDRYVEKEEAKLLGAQEQAPPAAERPFTVHEAKPENFTSSNAVGKVEPEGAAGKVEQEQPAGARKRKGSGDMLPGPQPEFGY